MNIMFASSMRASRNCSHNKSYTEHGHKLRFFLMVLKYDQVKNPEGMP